MAKQWQEATRIANCTLHKDSATLAIQRHAICHAMDACSTYGSVTASPLKACRPRPSYDTKGEISTSSTSRSSSFWQRKKKKKRRMTEPAQQNKTKQNKTKQSKAKQSKAKQNKTTQNKNAQSQIKHTAQVSKCVLCYCGGEVKFRSVLHDMQYSFAFWLYRYHTSLCG